MNKILHALCLTALALTACKKDKPQVALQATVVTPTPTLPVNTGPVSTVSGLYPSTISAGMTVTITGTNFGTLAADVTVTFAGTKATIQSVSPTQVTAIVPVLSAPSGSVIVTIGNQTITGLSYTTPAPLASISLVTQAQVDSFVLVNRGKQLQLTGNLYIGNLIGSKPDIHDISGLSNITTIAGSLVISNCPLLTDVSGLNNITSAGSINFTGIGATLIAMDKLTSINNLSFGSAFAFTNKALTKLSFKSLSNVNGSIGIAACPQLSAVDFNSLASLSGRLTITNTLLTDLSGFSSLQNVASLVLSGNTALVSLQGLDKLNMLTGPAFTSPVSASDLSLLPREIYIANNIKLISLAGLQNLSPTGVQVIFITGNTSLNDLCPIKSVINAVSKLGPYVTQYLNVVNTGFPEPKFNFVNQTFAALNLTSNGNYAATADALVTIANCK